MRTVLIADDQASVLQTLDYVFRLQDYAPLLANSGADAVRLAEQEPSVEAALIDLHMPGMDGFVACRAIRGRRRNLPIWIMTAAATAGLQAKAEAAGAIGVLRKPFDYPEYFAALERYCTKVEMIPTLPAMTAPAA
jgi:CheY-like chemotaxis protein